MHLLAYPWLTRIGFKMLAIAIVNQRIQVRRRLKVNAPTTSTVPTIRTSKGGKFFAAEVYRPVATITRLDINLCMIVKHQNIPNTKLFDL
jgi:hypothetical protein